MTTGKLDIKLDIKIDEIEKIDYHVVEKNLLDNATKYPEYTYKVPISSKLVLKFTGTDINNIFINTLRRISMSDIPVYAFCSDLIKITANTSVFNNDMMRCRLEQLPIVNTDCDIFYLEDKYWKDVDYSDPKRLKHPKETMIDLQINSYNDTNDIKNVTTSDIRYFEDGEEVLNKYNVECPILLVQLRPAETLKCT